MDTKASPSPSLSAAQAVFNTYELVELIILSLPGENIILPAKVNKMCLAVITTSPAITKSIQRTLDLSYECNSYPFASNEEDCFIRLYTHNAHIVIRRVGNIEVVGFLRHSGSLIIVDGECWKLRMMWVPRRHDEPGDWLACFQDTKEWRFWNGYVHFFSRGVNERRYLELYVGKHYEPGGSVMSM